MMMVCVFYDIYKGCATSLPVVNVHSLKKNALNLQSPPPKLYSFLHQPRNLFYPYFKLFQLLSTCRLIKNVFKI